MRVLRVLILPGQERERAKVVVRAMLNPENIETPDDATGAINETPPTEVPTHDQITERARKLWEDYGCPEGRDEEIWLEAERQLSTPTTPEPGSDVEMSP
jgi:hypothetical protein